MACPRRVFRLLVVQSVLVAMVAQVTEAVPQRRVARQRDDARPSTQWLCQREECSCAQDQQGLETVECDCTRAPQQEVRCTDITMS